MHVSLLKCLKFSNTLNLQDYSQQRPSQELVAKDLHGLEWRFRHIYRGDVPTKFAIPRSQLLLIVYTVFLISWTGQPRRHLLTTGWSAFVNKKKLVSGDAVLFVRYHVKIKMMIWKF